MTAPAAPAKTLDELTLGSGMTLEDLVSRDGLTEMVKSANELFGVPIRVFAEDGKLLADAADSIELYAYLNTSRHGRAALSEVVAAVKSLAPGPDGAAHYTCVTGASYRVVAIEYDSRQIGRMILGPYAVDPQAEPPASLLTLDPQLDADNACALGASYGGYMMNWIAGKWPDRFKCLVQHDGVFDARAMAYETEELWFDEWEHGGHPYYEAPDEFEKWNPVNYVDQWKTPMLVVTSEKDFRIPYTQGLAAFTALQMKKVPAELLVFPDENHWVLKPKNSLQWHQTVFGWLARWLKPSK